MYQNTLTQDQKKKEINELQRKHRAGLISRRDFMTMMAAVGATAIMSTVPGVSWAVPKKGGHLRLGCSLGSTTDSFDPRIGLDTIHSQCLNWAIRNNLTLVDKNGKLQPELAESIESSDLAKVWRFNLRKGVEFHNGKTFGPEDVIASMQLHRGETKSPGKTLLEDVESMEKDGNSVIFRLKHGSADFPFKLSAYQLTIVPSKNGEADWRSGVGTGGYIVESYEPGVRALVKRNPNFYKPDAAFVDSCELVAISDPSARITALIGKDVDAIDQIDLNLYDRVAKVSGLRVEEVTGMRHRGFPMLCDTPPFDNVDVRMALKLAIDREAILQKILGGHGSLGNDHGISPAYQYFNPNLEQRTYDPDKAKFHLKKAGVQNLKVALHVSDAAWVGSADTGVLYQEAAKKAGIEIEVKQRPKDGYWANVWMKEPFTACFYTGRPTEDWYFSSFLYSKAKWNDTHFKNPRFDKLLLEARSETDNNRRQELYFEMQRIQRDDGGYVIPVFANYTYAMANKVNTNGKISGNRNYDGGRVVERWSLES
jgi:peptide/nickel transport system substrate-binding protein